MDNLQRLRLTLITDRSITRLCLIKAVEAALQGGVTAVQIRERGMDSKDLLLLASQIKEATSHYGAALIINDRVDIALAVGADGVHVGSRSMPLVTVKKLLDSNANGMLLGFSAHNLQEAVGAEEGGADYITLSPIFPSHGKGSPIGPRAISLVKEHVRIPVIALGGIKVDTAPVALNNRADGVAAISAVIAHHDVKARAQALRKIVDDWFASRCPEAI
jgi:thiamine-phosphate pyrophosphorylase